MDINQYTEQTNELSVKLRGGLELKVEYRPNYMTGNVLKHIDKIRTKAEESFSFTDLHGIYVEQLVPVLSAIDLSKDGTPLPFSNEKEKKEALAYLSYQDLMKIDSAIRDDLAAPLVETGTDSSSGHLQKVE